MSKRDRKYFTFGIVHVNLTVIRELNLLGKEIKSEESMNCQSAIINICKGSMLGLKILAGSVLSMKKKEKGWYYEALSNVFQLLLENVQVVNLSTLDFMLAAEKLLSNLNKKSPNYEEIKKTVLSKTGKLKQVKGIISILEELFVSEDRHFSKGMTRRVIRGIINMQKERSSEWEHLIKLLQGCLDLLEGKNKGFWKPKHKNKKGGKTNKKKEFVMTGNLKRFLHKIIAETLVELLKFGNTKKEREDLTKLVSQKENSNVLKSCLNKIFRTEVTKGQKRSKVVLNIMKFNQNESVEYQNYLKLMDALIEDENDDPHMHNRKRECKNFIIGILKTSTKWATRKVEFWMKETEEALIQGNWKKMKNGFEGCGLMLMDLSSNKDFKQKCEWMLEMVGKIMEYIPNFQEKLKDNSQQRLFKEMSEFIFKKAKKIVLRTKEKKGQDKQRLLKIREYIEKYLEFCNKLLKTFESNKEIENEKEIKETFLIPNMTQIKINISNCLLLLQTAMSLEKKKGEKAIALGELLLNLSLRNVFLDNQMTEPLEIEIENEENKIEEENEEVMATGENAFNGAIRDLIKFSEEFKINKLGVDDYHILTDCLCVLVSEQDQNMRTKILSVFDIFGENYDEEVVELIDGFLFEDLDEKMEEMENNGFGMKLKHLDIGEDIMIDSDIEDIKDSEKLQIVQDLNLKKIKN